MNLSRETSLTLTVLFLGVVAPPLHGQAPRRPLVSPEVQADGMVTFRLNAPRAEKVMLSSGEMQPLLKTTSTPLQKHEDGTWSVTVGPLAPGLYDYTFNVDGVSITDPSSPHVFGNRQGSRGYVEVPGPRGKPRPDEWRDVPHGNVTIQWYDSRVSGSRRRLHVYTPPGYGTDAERKYPVLYLLHGSGDNDSHWMHIGRANVIADNLSADGRLVPMVIVMPDGHVKERPAGTLDEKTRQELRQAFEKDLLEQVVPLIESSYRVRTDAAGRAVAGLSMGSAQALAVGLGHPDKFAWIGAFSGALGKDDAVLAGLRDNSGLVNEQLKLLWLAIGKEDGAVKSKQALAATLTDLGIKHEYHETDGAHRWSVWRRYLTEFLPRLFTAVPLRAHADAPTLRKLAQVAAEAKVTEGQLDAASRQELKTLAARLTDAQVRRDLEALLPVLETAAVRHARDRILLAEIKRLGGTPTIEVQGPDWLRSIVGDDRLAVLGRIVEIDLNERTDGHKDPVPKRLSERVTDDWLKHLAGQDLLRRLELSGTAVTSAGLIHLKDLRKLERLNVCLTAVDDRGFEHLAGLTRMRRMVVCASKITGSGFAHLGGMKQLESINLHSSPASDAGLEAIGKLTSLRRLEIVHTKVTDAGLKHLAGLVHLRQLHVHGPETTALALPFLGQLQELYQLDVYDRPASNQTLEQIAKLPRLRLLMLPLGTFDDAGVRHLAKLTTLEELALDSPQMTDASIEHLAGLTNLRKLHLGRARISADGRQRLAKLLPRTVIGP